MGQQCKDGIGALDYKDLRKDAQQHAGIGPQGIDGFEPLLSPISLVIGRIHSLV